MSNVTFISPKLVHWCHSNILKWKDIVGLWNFKWFYLREISHNVQLKSNNIKMKAGKSIFVLLSLHLYLLLWLSFTFSPLFFQNKRSHIILILIWFKWILDIFSNFFIFSNKLGWVRKAEVSFRVSFKVPMCHTSKVTFSRVWMVKDAITHTLYWTCHLILSSILYF